MIMRSRFVAWLWDSSRSLAATAPAPLHLEAWFRVGRRPRSHRRRERFTWPTRCVLLRRSTAGCSAPVVRNDTPNVIRVDDVSPGVLRVTGLAVGTGRVRVLSPLDTTVSAAAAITVTP